MMTRTGRKPATARRSGALPYPLPPLGALALAAGGAVVIVATAAFAVVMLPILALADLVERSHDKRPAA